MAQSKTLLFDVTDAQQRSPVLCVATELYAQKVEPRLSKIKGGRTVPETTLYLTTPPAYENFKL
eukprot:4485720-Pleurochrysis_carterae.AAC.1